MLFEFFNLIDILSFFGWLLVFSIVAFFIYSNNKHNPEFKYFLPHFYYKIIAGLGFGLVYILYYERHGDTVFYWDGARKLNDLLFDNPQAYFHELVSTPPRFYVPSYFKNVGYPPDWIYNEPNSWFVCKVANFISFFTFGSYLTMNLFFSVIASFFTWKFFRYMNKILDIETRYLAIACLFIPSVAFWCSGIIKDTIALSAIFALSISFFKLIRKDYNSILPILFQIIIASYILYSLRPFLILATYIPFFVVLIFKLNNNKPFIVRFLTRTIGISAVLIVVTLYFRSDIALGEYSANNVIETANIIQNDLMNNAGYTGKRYDLGIDEFNGSSMIKAIPAAVNVCLFRPYIWEADSVFMLLNGFENTVILFLALRILWTGRKDGTFNRLISHEVFLFALLFVLLLGFFVGLTSGLFGTLVRLKTPIMPFFIILICYKFVDEKKLKKDSEHGLELEKK